MATTDTQREGPRDAQTPIPAEAEVASLLHEIFRKDAVNALREGFGLPVKPMGICGSILTTFLVTVLITVISFLATAKYARKETVLGQITPIEGAFHINAQIAGTAERVSVKEGQFVRAGTELISIAADPVLGNGEKLVESLMSIQAAQRRAQEGNAIARADQLSRQIEELEARRHGLQFDIVRLTDSKKLLERRKRLQLQNVDAYRKLAEKGMVSAAAVRQQDDVALGMQQQIQSAEREAGLQRSQLDQVRAQIRRLYAEAALARSEAAGFKAQLNERELNFEAQHSGKLLSPISGIVTALRVHAGTSVNQGQTLAVIIPSAGSAKRQLEVELWAPSRSVGFVRPGAKVRIMYDAFPYQTFGVGHGVVREVSGTPLSPGESSVSSESREQLFRIRVSLHDSHLMAYGRAWALVPGMRLSADLILEEQSLLEWLLAPLRAVSKRAI